MTSFELFERPESYDLNLSKIYKTLRKHQSLQKYNITHLFATCLSLNRFFHLTTANVVPESQNQSSEKITLQLKEGLEW
jgi:hypothetical protein